MCVKLLQLCLTLCDPMDCSPPGSSVHGILQARILEWVAMPSSRGSSQPRDGTCVSYVSCIGTPVVLYTSATWKACVGITTAENWLFLINTHRVISLLEGLPTELKTFLQNSVYKDILSNLIHNSSQLETSITHTKEWLTN